VEPKYLSDVQRFISHWKESYAQSLVGYHPEYCYYEFCTKIDNSNDFDFKWNNTTKVIDAPVGYLNPLGNTPDESIDPYFNPSQKPIV